jgi:hypothetical protein
MAAIPIILIHYGKRSSILSSLVVGSMPMLIYILFEFAQGDIVLKSYVELTFTMGFICASSSILSAKKKLGIALLFKSSFGLRCHRYRCPARKL